MMTLRILIVDDNVASAQTLGWMLELGNHTIQLAHDGENALAVAREFKPHVVLLDIGLPGLNGYELCALMRSEPELSHTIFIAQTGWGDAEHRRRSKDAGFSFHLVKPIAMDELEKLIASIAETVATEN